MVPQESLDQGDWCLGVHHGAGLSEHTTPSPAAAELLARAAAPVLVGRVSPANGSHLVHMLCPA